MKIKLFSNLRDIAGKDEITLEIESPVSLNDLFHSISLSYGETARQYLLKPTGQISDNLLVLINGRAISPAGENVKLSNEDDLIILPVLAGG